MSDQKPVPTMPDLTYRERLERAALAIYTSRDPHVVDRVRAGDNVFEAVVSVAAGLISAVDSHSSKPVSWTRVSHGVMGGVDVEPFGTFSVTVGDGETLAKVLVEHVPEVRALVEAAWNQDKAWRVACDRQDRDEIYCWLEDKDFSDSCTALESALAPFAEESDA